MAGDLPTEVHAYIEELKLIDTNRESLRNKAVEKFLLEHGGYVKDGIKHITKYRYNVETLSDGRRIYLLKPTWLNKGIDFQVMIEKYKDHIDARPSHKDIMHDLKIKKEFNAQMYELLRKDIDRVWNCEEPINVLRDVRYAFKKGFTIELILKCLKWLFIEQDITYWNYDGRGMLKRAIDKI